MKSYLKLHLGEATQAKISILCKASGATARDVVADCVDAVFHDFAIEVQKAEAEKLVPADFNNEPGQLTYYDAAFQSPVAPEVQAEMDAALSERDAGDEQPT